MSDIAIGLWFDNSQPPVLGWTLTLRVDQGTILLSFLAFLVTIAGTSAWGLIASLLHTLLARRKNGIDAIRLQHQVMLRNSAGALNTALDLMKSGYAWNKARSRNVWARTIYLATVALLTSALFAAASILTSRVANRGYSAILARSVERNCGIITSQSTGSHDEQTAVLNKAINDASQARNYAVNFYMNKTNTRAARSVFPVARLPSSYQTTTDCPAVNQTRCSQANDNAIEMQTELLDSHYMLGINAPPSERVSVQKKMTCAMVNVVDHMFITNSTIVYDLGPALGSPMTYTYYTNSFQDQVGYQIRYVVVRKRLQP